jgi:hypothetical protein
MERRVREVRVYEGMDVVFVFDDVMWTAVRREELAGARAARRGGGQGRQEAHVSRRDGGRGPARGVRGLAPAEGHASLDRLVCMGQPLSISPPCCPSELRFSRPRYCAN